MVRISEYIQFDKFDSKAWGLYLVEREIETPEENEQKTSVPGRHGMLNFAFATRERIFKNREVTYTFRKILTPYQTRKQIHTEITAQLMMPIESEVHETFKKGWHWRGSCKEVKISDDVSKREMEIEIVFEVYPFMIKNENYYNDMAPLVNYSDVLNYTAYEVHGERVIHFYNSGSRPYSPLIKVEV